MCYISGKKDDKGKANGKANGDAKKPGQGVQKMSKSNGSSQHPNRTSNTGELTHERQKAAVRVVKVPGMTMQQAGSSSQQTQLLKL